jgi:hypothetical protein
MIIGCQQAIAASAAARFNDASKSVFFESGRSRSTLNATGTVFLK